MARNNRLQVASRGTYSMLAVLWHRIVAVAAPGVAAEDATDGEV